LFRRQGADRAFAVTQGARVQWRNPEDVKASYPKASILKASRVIFNIKGNDYRLVAALQYRAGVLVIRFFGTHAEYDRIDAETY
jgi:mRNA interferase HigB